MEYYNNILCMTAGELTAVMTPSNYKQLSARGKITVARRACRGHRALVVVDSLPSKYREKVKEIYPEGSTMKLHECFRENFTLDAEARTFFSTFRFDNGSPLPADKVNEYTVNASAIRAVLRLMANTKSLRRAQFGGRVQWDEMAAAVAYFKQEYGHTLPESTLRLRKKVAQFNREGYACLISGKFQNQNTRRVNYRTERLILSLDCQPERPFNTTTHEMYLQFVCGELDVYDPETGELFDPEDFTDKNGEPIMLSEATSATI